MRGPGRCQSCRWYEKTDENQGVCHGGPPQLVVELQQSVINGQMKAVTMSRFAATPALGWCRVHEPALEVNGALEVKRA